MNLVFSNNDHVRIHVHQNSVTDFILKSVKHLQNISVDFKEWDNPYSLTLPKNLIIQYAKKLKLEEIDQTLLNDQRYLNYLHKIYEQSFDGNSIWLDFHEQIHRLENNNNKQQIIKIDWRTSAGPLNKHFEHSYLKDSVNTVSAGDVYISWSELGKIPYDYWKDQEPDNFNRMCELAKPWITLRPKFNICIEDINFLETKDSLNFNKWWQSRETQWCMHWNISEWNLVHQYSVIKIGSVDCINHVNGLLKTGKVIKKVIL